MGDLITAAYNQANVQRNQANKAKIFKYAIKDTKFQVVQTGICHDVRYQYDPGLDDNYISFTDINTGQRYCRSQFHVDIKEISLEESK
jgi:hypothetical protein